MQILPTSPAKRTWTEREGADFDIGQGLLGMLNPGAGRNKHVAIMRDFSVQNSLPVSGNIAALPWELALRGKRDMTVNGVSGSQFLVGADRADPFDALRAVTAPLRAGATLLTDLVGNLTVAEGTGSATTEWVDESGASTPSQTTVGALALTPHRLVATLHYSRQLVTQAPQFSAFVQRDLVAAIGAGLSAAALSGSGIGAEPMGLFAVPGVDTRAGTDFSWTQAAAMEKVCGAGNAESLTWICDPAAREIIRKRESSTSLGPMMVGSSIGGHPVITTTGAPTSSVAVGDWRRCLIALWGAGVIVQIDPYSDFGKGGMRVRAMVLADVGFASRDAFAVCTALT